MVINHIYNLVFSLVFTKDAPHTFFTFIKNEIIFRIENLILSILIHQFFKSYMQIILPTLHKLSILKFKNINGFNFLLMTLWAVFILSIKLS